MAARTPAPPDGLSLAPGWWEAVEALYATPPRAYHTADHVRAVLDRWAEVDAEGGWTGRAETWLALLLHDAVYDAGRSDNEARSAALVEGYQARFALRDARGASPDLDRVRTLIALTARHGRLRPGEVDPEAACFLDCDLAVLGAPPEEFDAYDRGVRAEYAPVLAPEAFEEGRRRFLEGLLAAPRLFLSDRFHARWDAPARANLARALATMLK